MASCVLHNLIRMRNPTLVVGDIVDPNTQEVIDGCWRADQSMTSLVMSPTRASQHGRRQRNYLRDYFMSPAGSVPWQTSSI